MGYHIRLNKALSYCGLVTATKKQPDVFVEDEATAKAALATGYFKLVEETETQGEEAAAHLGKAQLEDMKVDELKQLAMDMGIDITGFKKKADYVEAIAAAEIIPGPENDEDGNEVYYGESSQTMTELQDM